jgi:hypothetical protein
MKNGDGSIGGGSILLWLIGLLIILAMTYILLNGCSHSNISADKSVVITSDYVCIEKDRYQDMMETLKLCDEMLSELEIKRNKSFWDFLK